MGGSVGVWIGAIGCALRRSRVQGAQTYGIQAIANFSIEGCTIGKCGLAKRGGGILTRAGVMQVRGANGIDENRVQREWFDKGYSGYDCRGCVGVCVCSSFALVPALLEGPGSAVKWGIGWVAVPS